MSISYDFTDRRILVTGASAGIGRGICVELAKAGAQVFALARRADALAELVAQGEKAGYKHKIVAVVGDTASSQETLTNLITPLFPLDGLVNNAGIAKNAQIGGVLQKDFDDVYACNVRGPIILSQILAVHWIARKHPGVIVNMSSQAGIRPLENHLVYCSSKAALDMVTRTLALDLGIHNIRVNSVNPTVVWTDMGRDNWTDKKKVDNMLEKMPIKRFAEIEEVVNATLYLLSDASSLTTGMPLTVDGGFSFS
ncbi:unnamed protein product [Caenorhabditis angaria]|uniref:Uncharacterized protein n=1 Tax=Caenorhabditis angaria TaxID=860376 RepID=A0A9P1N6W0_9PELO|nr:unnamed protein product [Caenorhabditis angaria]